jgi:parvulin-like peptidyl-prolyl isomerase
MKLLVLVATCAAFLCAQAPQLPADTVVATADGKPLTAGQLRGLLSFGDPNINRMASQNPEQFLVNIAIMRYLTEEGEKAHLGDESPVKEQLQMIRDKLIGQEMLNRLRETYKVPEKDMQDYYEENKSKYAQAWIKVIVLGFCPDAPTAKGTSVKEMEEATKQLLAHNNCASARGEKETLDLATTIVGRIRGGEDFLKYVKQYSEDDDSKATDGDFGLVTHENSFRPEIKKAVFDLKDGQISDPIKSGAAFYIIKIKEETIRPLADVLDSVVNELKQKHFTEMLSELTKRFKPTIDHPEFFTSPAPPKAAK